MKEKVISGIKYNLNKYDKYKYEVAHLCAYFERRKFLVRCCQTALLIHIRIFFFKVSETRKKKKKKLQPKKKVIWHHVNKSFS